MMYNKESLFTAYFRYSNGRFEAHVGWFWVAVAAGLVWWVL